MIPAEYSVPVQGKWAGYFHSKSWVIEVHHTRWLCILIMLWIIKGLLYFPLSSFLYSSSPHQQINAECLGICPAQTLAHFIFSLETFCSSSFEPLGFDHLVVIGGWMIPGTVQTWCYWSPSTALGWFAMSQLLSPTRSFGVDTFRFLMSCGNLLN